MASKLIKRVSIGCGSIMAALFFITLTAVLAMGLATKKAERFCNQISIGEPVEAVVKRAQADSGIIVLPDAPSAYTFLFYTFLPGPTHATCGVLLENGRVKSKFWRRATD